MLSIVGLIVLERFKLMRDKTIITINIVRLNHSTNNINTQYRLT